MSDSQTNREEPLFQQRQLEQPQEDLGLDLLVPQKQSSPSQQISSNQQDLCVNSWGSRRKWSKGFKIISICYPTTRTTRQNSIKRFCVRFFFEADGKQHCKSVFFGEKGKSQFIDDKDNLKRDKRRYRYIHGNDLFHPAFWRINMLNNKQTMEQSYIALLKQLGITKRQEQKQSG